MMGRICLGLATALLLAPVSGWSAGTAESGLRKLAIRHTADVAKDLARFSYETEGGETKTVVADGSASLPPGTRVRLVARPAVQNLDVGSCKVCGDYEYEYFQWWTVSPASADLGVGFRPVECETEMTMPVANVTLKPSYILASKAGWLTMHAFWATSSCGLEPDEDDFEWSPDGKHWFRSGESCIVKAGTRTVTWRSLNAAWLAPAKVKIRVLAEDEVDNSATGRQDSLFVPAVTFAGDVETVGGGLGGTVSVSPKSGVLASGKKVTLTASPKSGYVFLGFRAPDAGPDEFCTAEKKLVLTAGDPCQRDDSDGKIHYTAVFRLKKDYREADLRAGISVSGNGFNGSVDFDSRTPENPIRLFGLVGCPLEATVSAAVAASPATATYSGKLPSGVKFAGKTFSFSGTPTKAGSFVGSVAVKDPGGHVVRVPFEFLVRELPAGRIGGYTALLREGDSDCSGAFEMSVSKAGKVSAKLTRFDGSVSFTGNLIWTPAEGSPDPAVEIGDLGFILSHRTAGFVEGRFADRGAAVSFSGDGSTGFAFPVDKTAASGFARKTYTLPLRPDLPAGNGYLVLSFDARGSVKTAGLLPDGTTVSWSAPASGNPDGSVRILLFTAKKSKGVQFHAELLVRGDGVSVVDAVWLRKDLAEICAAGARTRFRGDGAVYRASASLAGATWTLTADGAAADDRLTGSSKGAISLTTKDALKSFSFTKSTGVFSGTMANGLKFKGVMVGADADMEGFGTVYGKKNGISYDLPLTIVPDGRE